MDAKPDLHVVSLRYKLRPSDQVTYLNPAPVAFEETEVRFRLEEGKLTCEMKSHVSTAEEARAIVEPVLRAWEADADLRGNRGGFRFEFVEANIIDRSPCPPGVNRLRLFATLGAVNVSAFGMASLHVTRRHYPDPPVTFRLNPDAESLLFRYQGFLDGHEPLLSMAFFCLTVVESKAGPKTGRRASAAKMFRIDELVLKKMGELTSERGDPSSARKATAGPARPLTGPEREWLEAALKALIWRLGDTRPAAALPKITLADLPRL